MCLVQEALSQYELSRHKLEAHALLALESSCSQDLFPSRSKGEDCLRVLAKVNLLPLLPS